MGAFGGLLLPLLLPGIFALNSPALGGHGITGAPVLVWLLMAGMEAALLAVGGVILLSLAGPDDLAFDLRRRTYRHVFGWPIRPLVRDGPWEDLAGVYVWEPASRNMPGIYVGVTWKGDVMRMPLFGVLRFTVLGEFSGLGRMDRANALASEVTAALGLPLVAPPVPAAQPPPRL